MWTLWNNETFKTGSLKCFMKWLCLQRNNLLLKFMNNGYSVFNDQRQQARNDSVTNMRIIFTNKLSKMVAHYEYLRVLIQQQNNGEKWQTTRQKTNLENFVLRERLADKNGWQHYVYQAGECALHGTYVRATGIAL